MDIGGFISCGLGCFFLGLFFHPISLWNPSTLDSHSIQFDGLDIPHLMLLFSPCISFGSLAAHKHELLAWGN